jgi:ubiquinone/menaquinone biosynthesis C-methylase UbiE
VGANLPYFPVGVRWVGVEPNPCMHRYLREAAARLGLNLEIRLGDAEEIPAKDSSVDAVVATLVLCTVRDPAAALREIRRVLRPGGRFLFIEHVAAAEGSRLRRLQHWASPFFKLFAGCHPDRETWDTLQRAGFRNLRIEHFQIPAVLSKPHIMGVGIK